MSPETEPELLGHQGKSRHIRAAGQGLGRCPSRHTHRQEVTLALDSTPLCWRDICDSQRPAARRATWNKME